VKTRGNHPVHGPLLMLKLQGAPRGLLLYYVLHKISQGPTHGYEITQDIEEKTDGAWRPAPGSIYPMLKKLVSQSLIKAASESGTKRSSENEQRVYEITPLGKKYLEEGKEMFANAGQRFGSVRKIFIEMIEPRNSAKFFTEGARMHFEGSRAIVESKMGSLPPSELESILKEYAINLERQLEWTKAKIAQMNKRYAAVTPQGR
jgi:DNA-binding PadR family transcriptional regulator